MKNLTAKLMILALVVMAGLVMPHKASAQFYDNGGFNYGGSGYDNSGGGFYDGSGFNYGGSGGYTDPGYSYGDPGYVDNGYNYSYDNSCCSYDSGYNSGYSNSGYDCCGYNSGYSNYGYDNCCSYSGSSYYPSYSGYSTPSYYYNNNQNQNNNYNYNNSYANATANNTNNIIINGGTGNNPPPVVNPLSVNCYGSPSNPDVNQTVTWTANASGGNGNYSYSWNGDASGSGRTVSQSYGNSGVKNATVNVTDSSGHSTSASCSVNVGNNNTANLNVYCVGSPSNPNVNEEVSWTAYASGGDGNYNYRWSGDTSGSSRTEYETYGNSGTYQANIRVTDGNGDSASDSCSVYVQPHGSIISNVTYYQPPYGTPSSGVYLSQIPATGISPTLKMTLFTLGLTLFSAFGAYMIMEKRRTDRELAELENSI